MPNNPRHLRPNYTSVHDFFRYYANDKKEKSEDVFCLQIGANDGINYDPVNQYFNNFGWHGLLIEPQRDVFENGLCKTYAGNKRVILENVAIGAKEGELPFYRVAISKSIWATGLSSFVRRSIEYHISNNYIITKAREEGVEIPSNPDDIIETVYVPTVIIDTLLKKHHINRVNVVCIDTEGYDFELLKLMNLGSLKPEIVFFESKNLSDEDFVSAKHLLEELGYSLFWEKGDTLAIRYNFPTFRKICGRIKAIIKKI